MLTDLWYRIRALFGRKAMEEELADELQYHLERQTQKYTSAGLSPEHAARRARIELGGVTQAKEETRQSWGVAQLDATAHDTIDALRMLRKSPGFTAAVVLSLALGIGANTAIFSLMDAVIWRMLPIRDAQSLWTTGGLTFQQYRALRDLNQVADLEAYSPARFNVSVDGSIEPTAEGQLVSGSFFSLLGVSPAAGRAIAPDDDLVPNGHPVAMISYGYWKRRFDLAPSAVGRDIAISGLRFTIIGVTPPEFFGIEVGSAPDIFVPVMMQPTVMPVNENLLKNPIIYSTWLRGVARLKPGVHAQQAAQSMTAIYKQYAPRGPKAAGLPEPRLELTSAANGISALRRQFSQPLVVLMVIVGIVLLIACANTANLLLARATARGSEFAMRLALGAGRGRLTRQLLVESVVLALLGGGAGILLARLGTQVLVNYMSVGRAPIVLNLDPSLRVLVFTLAISLVTGILFGLTPAMRATRIDLTLGLKTSSRSVTGVRADKVFAVAQVSLSLLLLVAAGLFVRSLLKLNGAADDSRESVLVVRVEPRGSDQRGIPGTTARLDRTYRELINHVQTIPGVRAASMGQATPTRPIPGAGTEIRVSSGERVRVPIVMLYPGYLATVGMSLMAGRDFDAMDLGEHSAAVCMVNETFARRVFPGESPLGKLCFSRGPDRPVIVGVVRDSRYTNPRGEAGPLIFMTFLQTPTGRGQMVLHARVAGNTGIAIQRIREEVAEVDPTLPMFDVHTLADEMDAALVQERMIATLSSLFGGLALVLASVGLFGLLSYGVVQRTREMGIRMALGARRGSVTAMVMREALLLVGLGVVIGVPLAVTVARIASSRVSGLLYGLRATDPVTMGGAVVVLVVVGVSAAYLPARRASRVDPMTALRNE